MCFSFSLRLATFPRQAVKVSQFDIPADGGCALEWLHGGCALEWLHGRPGLIRVRRRNPAEFGACKLAVKAYRVCWSFIQKL